MIKMLLNIFLQIMTSTVCPEWKSPSENSVGSLLLVHCCTESTDAKFGFSIRSLVLPLWCCWSIWFGSSYFFGQAPQNGIGISHFSAIHRWCCRWLVYIHWLYGRVQVNVFFWFDIIGRRIHGMMTLVALRRLFESEHSSDNNFVRFNADREECETNEMN